MKKIICIIIAIFIIIGAILLKNNIRKYDIQIEKISEYNYYIYKDEEKFGVIDKTGKTIIEAKYNDVIIPNPEKAIFACYDNEKVNILNSEGKKIFTEYDEVEPIKLKSVASDLTYEKSVLKYKKNGLYGLIDFNGKKITKNIYNSIENLQPTEGKFLVTKDEKYGIIDLKGNTLVNTKYNSIMSDGYYTSENEYIKSGFIVAEKKEDGFRYGYIDYTGKMILDTKFNEIERISKDDNKNIYLITSENGKYGLYNRTKQIIKNDYQQIFYLDDTNLVEVQKNQKFGVFSLDGKNILDVSYEEISLKGIYLYAKSKNENKVYDYEGNIIDINFNKTINLTENENYKISTLLNNNITYYGIIDKNGNQLVEEKYRYIEYLYKDYFIATDETGAIGVIDENESVILNFEYNSLQKIKGKRIIQAVNNSEITKLFNENMEEILSLAKPIIQIYDQYITITDLDNKDNKIYFDNNGNKKDDLSNIKNYGFPDKIGEYVKEEVTIEIIYYVKNK